jgi:hypothetical protein
MIIGVLAKENSRRSNLTAPWARGQASPAPATSVARREGQAMVLQEKWEGWWSWFIIMDYYICTIYIYVYVSVYVYVSWVFQTFSPFSCGFNGHKYTQHTAIAESRPFQPSAGARHGSVGGFPVSMDILWSLEIDLFRVDWYTGWL